MKHLFHGTTKANYDQIKVEGFNPKNTNWYCSNSYNTYLRFFYISGLIASNNPNIDISSFNDIEHKAIDMISKSDIYLDELLEIEWKSMGAELALKKEIA